MVVNDRWRGQLPKQGSSQPQPLAAGAAGVEEKMRRRSLGNWAGHGDSCFYRRSGDEVMTMPLGRRALLRQTSGAGRAHKMCAQFVRTNNVSKPTKSANARARSPLRAFAPRSACPSWRARARPKAGQPRGKPGGTEKQRLRGMAKTSWLSGSVAQFLPVHIPR